MARSVPVVIFEPAKKKMLLVIGNNTLEFNDLIKSTDGAYFGTLNDVASLQIIKALVDNLE